MTQLAGAVGGANDDPVIAAEPTIEDRMSAAIGAAPDEGEGDPPNPEASEEEAPAAEPELTEEDVDEAEPEEAPAIDPPSSWTTEEKAIFAQLPPEAQKAVARREGEREKFLQEKSQEAARTRQTVEKEALGAIQSVQQRNAQALQSLLVQIPPEPTAMLQVEDPYAYAEQKTAHDNAAAHNRWVEQSISQALQQAQAAERALTQQRQAETADWLRDNFPDFMDAAKGPEIRQQLASTASELGIPAELTTDLTHIEIAALKKASEWKAKAEKLDTLMANKMQKVRAAKDLPRVSRPGVPQGKNAIANERYTADREAMKQGDMHAAARAISRFI